MFRPAIYPQKPVVYAGRVNRPAVCLFLQGGEYLPNLSAFLCSSPPAHVVCRAFRPVVCQRSNPASSSRPENPAFYDATITAYPMRYSCCHALSNLPVVVITAKRVWFQYLHVAPPRRGLSAGNGPPPHLFAMLCSHRIRGTYSGNPKWSRYVVGVIRRHPYAQLTIRMPRECGFRPRGSEESAKPREWGRCLAMSSPTRAVAGIEYCFRPTSIPAHHNSILARVP